VKRKQTRGVGDAAYQRSVLSTLSDDLALPLLQIKTTLELIDGSRLSAKNSLNHTKAMALSAEAGLQLIEAYRLALKIQDENNLQIEPVAVGSVLQEVAHNLAPYAKSYDTFLEIDIQGKLTPVLTNRQTLTTALQCLGSSFIRAQAAQSESKRHKLMLGARRVPDNAISTGVFGTTQGLSDRTLRTARSLAGRARQPVSGFPAGTASGVLIADMLCGAMWQPLRATAHRNLHGLAVSVPISKQLQFV
jgi:hypothetical protein